MHFKINFAVNIGNIADMCQCQSLRHLTVDVLLSNNAGKIRQKVGLNFKLVIILCFILCFTISNSAI